MTTLTFLYGWESIKPRQMSTLEKAYRIALDESKEANRKYCLAVDFWIDMRTQYGDESRQAIDAEVRLNHLSDECDRMEDKVRTAWARLNCPHTHVKPAKELIPGTEPYNVCVLCGAAEDEFHTRTIRDIA